MLLIGHNSIVDMTVVLGKRRNLNEKSWCRRAAPSLCMPENIGTQECAHCQSYTNINHKFTLSCAEHVLTTLFSLKKVVSLYKYTVRPRLAKEERDKMC